MTPMRTENRLRGVRVWELQLAGRGEARAFQTPAEALSQFAR